MAALFHTLFNISHVPTESVMIKEKRAWRQVKTLWLMNHEKKKRNTYIRIISSFLHIFFFNGDKNYMTMPTLDGLLLVQLFPPTKEQWKFASRPESRGTCISTHCVIYCVPLCGAVQSLLPLLENIILRNHSSQCFHCIHKTKSSAPPLCCERHTVAHQL